jgi:hypothetical protein
MAEFMMPTAKEFDAAARRGARRMKQSLLALRARYDQFLARVVVVLNNGAFVGFPPSVVPGLEHAAADDFRSVEAGEGRYGLPVEALDADVAVPRLPEDHLGSTAMKMAQARTAGRG